MPQCLQLSLDQLAALVAAGAVLVGGPFPTQQTCVANCGSSSPSSLSTSSGSSRSTSRGSGGGGATCQGLVFQVTGNGTLAFSNGTGQCTCLNGYSSNVGTGLAGTDEKHWQPLVCESTNIYELTCVAGVYAFKSDQNAPAITSTLVSFTASPFVVVFDLSNVNCAGSPTGTVRATITFP